jgi:hypothetical protein
MKARIIATGNIYNVIDMNDYRNRFKLEDHNWYTMGEIELIEDNEPDRQKARIRFVGQIASAIMINYRFFAPGIAEECGKSGKSRPEMIAQMSIEIADALIEGLEKGEQDE